MVGSLDQLIELWQIVMVRTIGIPIRVGIARLCVVWFATLFKII